MPDQATRATTSGTTLLRRTAVDWLPSVVLAGVGAHELLYNHAPAWQWLTAVGIVVALGFRRRVPVAVLAVTLLLAVAGWSQGVLLVVHLGVVIALHAVAWQRSRAETIAAAVVVEAGAVYVAFAFAPAGSVNDGVVLLTGMTLTAVLLGTSQRAQREYTVGLEDRAEQLRRERNQRAVIAAAEERTRIAREVHDIVAHSVSVMVALSEGAARTPDDAAARASMRQVAATGRGALTELRRVLTVLHTPADDASASADGRAPQPSFEALGDLARDVELAGLAVDLQVDGDPSSLSEGLQATVFRVVQESLTNVLKHAAADRATVRIAVTAADVTVRVSDDGRAPQHVVAGLGDAGGPGGDSGNGIRGMRERARLYDGSVVAGPRPDAPGWTVSCRLLREEG